MKTSSSLNFLKLLAFWQLCNDPFLKQDFFFFFSHTVWKQWCGKAWFIHALDNWSLKITVHTLAKEIKRYVRFTALNIHCPVLVKILSALTVLLNPKSCSGEEPLHQGHCSKLSCCSLCNPYGILLDELSLTVSNFCTLEHTDVSPSFCHWFELNLHVASLLYCHDSFKSKCFRAWLAGVHYGVGSQTKKTLQCHFFGAYVWKGKWLKNIIMSPCYSEFWLL